MSTDIWCPENIDTQGIFYSNKSEAESNSHNYKSFAKGAYIYEQQKMADKLYFIISGRVKIGVRNSQEKCITKEILDDGEIFGEKVLVGQKMRTNFAFALEKTQVCIIHSTEIKSLYKENNSLFLFLIRLISKRGMKMENRIESLMFKSSRSRVVEFLLELNREKGERVGYEWVVRNFITHQDIADLTTTSRQTVTTVLNDLKTKNILTSNRKRLLIRDLDMLTKELSLA